MHNHAMALAWGGSSGWMEVLWILEGSLGTDKGYLINCHAHHGQECEFST